MKNFEDEYIKRQQELIAQKVNALWKRTSELMYKYEKNSRKKIRSFKEACAIALREHPEIVADSWEFYFSKIGQKMKKEGVWQGIKEQPQPKKKKQTASEEDQAEDNKPFTEAQLRRMIIDAQRLQWANERHMASTFKEKGYEAEKAPSAYEVLKGFSEEDDEQ